MNITNTDANSLLTAQLTASQRQTVQDRRDATQRDQTQVVQDTARQQNAQAPQSQLAVTAADTNDSGRAGTSRRDLPRDAQSDARAAQERNGGTAPRRGSVVNVFA